MLTKETVTQNANTPFEKKLYLVMNGETVVGQFENEAEADEAIERGNAPYPSA